MMNKTIELSDAGVDLAIALSQVYAVMNKHGLRGHVQIGCTQHGRQWETALTHGVLEFPAQLVGAELVKIDL